MRRRPSFIEAVAVGMLAAVTTVASCGESDASGCGPPRRQQAQSDSLVHVLPGQPDPTYLSSPPTSGPHTAIPRGVTVYKEPLSRAAQVGVLERGDVLVQYRPDRTDATTISALEALAGPNDGPGAIVAPNSELSDPIIASAWLYLQSCTSLQEDRLRAFISDRAGKGPSVH